MGEPFDLQRFVEAQNPIYQDVCSELRSGRKRGHWMWYVFPQLRGLGQSALSERFGISSLDEAKAYIEHTILGPRLMECTSLVNAIASKDIEDIFYYPDDLKFRSCVTLFAKATKDNQVFMDALNKYFEGQFDPQTLELVAEF